MAGKTQHYLPRFLLSGFASRITRKDDYCFVYHSDGRNYEPNIKGIGAQNYFYGKPSESDADELITDAEGEYSLIVDDLRLLTGSTALDYTDIAHFIANLSIRTRNVRETVSVGARQIFEDIKAASEDPEYLRCLVLRDLKNDVGAIWDRSASPGQKWADLPRWKRRIAKKRLIEGIENLPGDDPRFERVLEVFEGLSGHINSSLRQGHISALEKSVAPPNRVRALECLNWRILVFPDHSLILGDVGVIARCLQNKEPMALAWATEELNAIYLPISHSHLLVGTDSRHLPQFDSQEVNVISASLSWDFFASSIQAESRNRLSGLIGSKCTDHIEKVAAKTTKRI